MQPKSKRGPKPQKGERLRKLSSWFSDAQTVWCVVEVDWYGGQRRVLGYRSGVCLWYTEGHSPVPLRWVLVRFEEKPPRTGAVTVKSGAFFCSSPEADWVTAEWVLGVYQERWNIEVTFEEVRRHLGLETQRHWSKRSIERTTPCLLGIFSVVVLMGQRLHPSELPVRSRGWYGKEEATFSDVLGAVRSPLWGCRNNAGSLSASETCLIPVALWRQVQEVLAYAA